MLNPQPLGQNSTTQSPPSVQLTRTQLSQCLWSMTKASKCPAFEVYSFTCCAIYWLLRINRSRVSGRCGCGQLIWAKASDKLMGGAGFQRAYCTVDNRVYMIICIEVQKLWSTMRLSFGLFSFTKRLLPAVFGISKQGVRIEPKACSDPSTSCVAQVGEDACFFTTPSTTEYQVFGKCKVVTRTSFTLQQVGLYYTNLCPRCCWWRGRVAVRGNRLCLLLQGTDGVL